MAKGQSMKKDRAKEFYGFSRDARVFSVEAWKLLRSKQNHASIAVIGMPPASADVSDQDPMSDTVPPTFYIPRPIHRRHRRFSSVYSMEVILGVLDCWLNR